MSMDRNEWNSLERKVPTVLDKELPDVEGRLDWVTSQYKELCKAMYRQVIEVMTAKNYITKDDPDASIAAENKIKEATGNIKGLKWTLEVLRAEKARLLAEKKSLKPSK